MRGWMMVSAAMAMLASPLAAQETRVAPDDHVPPPATLEQMDWLVGQWTGTGIGGAPAMESWLPPSGNTMVGTFVQETAEGGIRFTEHLYLMEEEGTLVLRLKHFNADFTGWEEKDGMLTFRLIAVEDCAAYFRSLTLRCDGENGLLAAVRMKSEGDEINELIFRFEQMGKSASDGQIVSSPNQCEGSTRELNRCFAGLLNHADDERLRYFKAALAKASEWSQSGYMPAAGLEDGMRASERAFEVYRNAECALIVAREMGSIRTIEMLACMRDLTQQRTRAIWQNWLTYPDGKSPVLPEPQPTR